MNEGGIFCFDTPPNVFSKSEELEKIGLDVPQVTKIFNLLKKAGIDFGEGVYTVKYAEKLLKRRLENQNGGEEA
jgi:energy-coupling factor transport system ATP-binding protein